MGEEGGIEIKAAVVSLRKFYPSLEMTGFNGIAVDGLTVFGNCVVCVNVDFVSSGNQRECLIKVGKNLIGGSCTSYVVTCGLNTAGKACCSFKSENVVSLPAVHADAHVGKRRNSRFGIDAVLRVDFLGRLVSCVCHDDLLLVM